MSADSPTWYDVLGVSRDATPEEIKAAWRQATDRFEPGSGSGQFQMFNRAADVLLEPERRRAYDEALEAEAGASPLAPVPAEPREVPETAAGPEPEQEDRPRPRRGRRRVALRGRAADTLRTPGGRFVSALGSLNIVALTALAVITVLVVAGAAVAGTKVREESQLVEARSDAPPAAERAAEALFSYDYRSLPADRIRAKRYLAGSFAQKYLKNFDALEKQKDGSPGLAVQTKAVVTASSQGSGVVDAGADKARVLVFVNVVSRKAEGDPQIFQNRVAMTMRKDGDRWLVSNVNSY
jgi:Mce-associated membrane protein